jgi:hypothetical protein
MRSQPGRPVVRVEPILIGQPSRLGEHDERAVRPEHVDDLADHVVDAARGVQHAIREHCVEGRVDERQRVRVRLHELRRSRARGAQAVEIEVDADAAPWQEPALATPEVEDPAVGQRRDLWRRPLDRIEIR